MSSRVQVILDDDEAAQFRSQAVKESKSLSAWLREAGKRTLEAKREHAPLTRPDALKEFFKRCNQREQGVEPEWEDHKLLIMQGFRADKRL